MSSSRPEKILVVCHSPGKLATLSAMLSGKRARVTLASENPETHELARNASWIDDVVWIETLDSYYSVAEDTIRLLESVNVWLGSLADAARGFESKFLKWPQHVEGGDTAQRVQDIVLLIRSYHKLLDSVKPDLVLEVGDNSESWAVWLLQTVVEARTIPFRRVGFARKHMRWRAATLAKNRLRHLRMLVRVTRAGARREQRNQDGRPEIAIQLCGDTPKLIDYTLALMPSLARKGYATVAVCWGAPAGASAVRSAGFYADELEAWLTPGDVIDGWCRARRAVQMAARGGSRLLSSGGLTYEGIPIAQVLWPSIVTSIWRDSPRNHLLGKAAVRYFAEHHPVALRAWAAQLPEGRAVIDAASATPLVRFASWPFAYLTDPYNTTIDPADLELAWGPSHVGYLRQHGVPDGSIAVVGRESVDYNTTFIAKFDRATSLQILAIPDTYSFYVVHDLSVVVRGAQSHREVKTLLNAVLDYAQHHPDVAILVKPHPSRPDRRISETAGRDIPPNVFVLARAASPHHLLNVADVLITKFSTLGVDAMDFGVPVIAALLDGEDRFRIFGDAAEYVRTTDDLLAILGRVLRNRTAYETWADAIRERQVSFRENLISKSDTSSAERAATAVCRLIESRSGPNLSAVPSEQAD